MKKIPLTQGKVALVDDEDFERLNQYKWQALQMGVKKGRRFWYARRMTSLKDGPRRAVYMHREVMNAADGTIPDHIDFNGLNNQKSNLRIVSRSDNCRWSRGRKERSSRYKGVTRARGKWMASIKLNGHSYTLTHCKNEEEAALYYNVAAQICFGEFAYLNDV